MVVRAEQESDQKSSLQGSDQKLSLTNLVQGTIVNGEPEAVALFNSLYAKFYEMAKTAAEEEVASEKSKTDAPNQ